jgi:long-chain acyl-CoA synthetase
VREVIIPPTITVSAHDTACEPAYANERDRPGLVSFSRPDGAGGWQDVTAAQFAKEVRAVAKGLIVAGVQAGDRIALMARNRYEWALLDYAIWSVAAVSVPVYETSSAEQVAWILSDSGAVAVVVETAEHEAVVEKVRPDLPGLRKVWQLDADAVGTLTGLGRDTDDAEVDARRAALRADDLATIIYTSGTTGRPKGCMLTHRNIMSAVLTAADGLASMFHSGATTIHFLPLAHVFGRLVQCGAVWHGATLRHTADVRELVDDLEAFRPTFILAVPRVFEKVYNTARQRAHAEGHGRIYDAAERVAIAYSEAMDRGKVPPLLRIQHGLFDKIVYTRIRAALGGRCLQSISGGAPLGPRLGHFFRGVGLTVYEGYGLTETAAGGSVNRPGAQKIGTVGQPLPGGGIRIAEDGEILLSGENIFAGYWHNDEATAEVLTDGWFRTGDIGELDDEGYLTITGRKKEILVTAGGKNVAPAVLEDRLRAHPLVSQCMVVGDAQPYIACLVTLDEEELPAWLTAHGKPADLAPSQLREDPEITAEIQRAVDEANQAVSRAESIRKFRILGADFTEESGELTPTLKLKRSVVLKERADELAALYR